MGDIVNKELLKEMIDYIKNMEITIEGEWGNCRKLEQILKDKEMPELYYKLLTEYNGFVTEC